MGLQDYKKKRKFSKTPEPASGTSKADDSLTFVIQKHAASHLHYDLRLEVDGVLKSWAVPKGPSVNPEDKRLAMMVEDHPFDYKDFEGIIPEGNYGAGTVIVWDEGTYTIPGIDDPKEANKLMRNGLREGKLVIELNGEKLKGGFHLVKIKSKSQKKYSKNNSWLFFKHKDKYAGKADITKKDKSIKSGKTLEQVCASDKNKNEPDPDPERTLSGAEMEALLNQIKKAGGAKKTMPHHIEAQFATLTDEPFDSDEWLFEIKWDGYRAVAEIHPEKTPALYSRNLKSFNKKFAPVADALQQVPFKAIFDGEVVILDKKGKSDFQALQNYQRTGEGNLVYYIFDLLYFEGYDLRNLPLIQRKEILKEVLPEIPSLLYSDHVEDQGKKFYEAAKKMNLEGIIAKSKDSRYYAGKRTKDWLKIKVVQEQEFVIGGFTEPRNSRQHLGALLLGVYEKGKLIYCGMTGGGFKHRELKEMRALLDKYERKTSPFANEIPKSTYGYGQNKTPVHFVKPELVAEVKFSNWTDEGLLRQAIFQRLRDDKKPTEVKRVEPVSPPAS